MEIRPIDANALVEVTANYRCGLHGVRRESVEKIFEYINNAPTLDYVPRQQWISVNDRLPEKADTYIVTVNDGIQAFSAWDVYHPSHGWCAEGGNVTHWMPLPEPPKEL